ncbi:MAG: GGDEF domain-containing protein [Anaerolineales bacterium]
MNHSNQFYKKLLDHLYDGVYFVDRQRRITYWNSGAERITGYKAEQVLGKSCSDNILNHCTEDGCELCTTTCPLVHSIKTGELNEVEVFLHHANGHRLPVSVRTSPIFDETGHVVGAVEIFNNNSKAWFTRQKMNALQQKAFSDSLTQASNRRFFETHFQSLREELEHEGIQHGLLFLDIDHFKQVNDQYGHPIGDQVLVMAAQTLRANLRASDLVIRWGGEEFVVLLRDNRAAQTRSVAEKLRALIERSYLMISEVPLRVTVSIGATLLRSDDTLESVIQRADALMYQSKSAGRNQVTFAE